MRSLIASPSAFVRRPAATAASTRSLSAVFNASLSLLGEMPSCFAASSMIALLSSLDDPVCDAAIAAPPPAAASTAAAPTAILFFRLMLGLLPRAGRDPRAGRAGRAGRDGAIASLRSPLLRRSEERR